MTTKFSNDHEWATLEGDTATIGVTGYAAHHLGDVVFVELPSIGQKLTANQVFGTIESVKTVSDLLAPLSGEVIEANAALESNPALVNESPLGDAWICKIKVSDKSEFDKLLSEDDYKKLYE